MRTKRCPRCETVKPWTEFYPREYWPDGSLKNVLAYCRPCHAQKVNAWHRDKRKTDPDWQRARGRRAHELTMADPERKAQRLAYQREWARRTYGYRRVLMRPTEKQDELLSAGPFCEWLAAWRERENLTALDLADRLGLSERNARAFALGQRDVVPLAVVERALIREGRTMLHELYPSLYTKAAA